MTVLFLYILVLINLLILFYRTGLYFVKQQQQAGLPILPNHCFIADEAMTWIMKHFEDVNSKVEAVAYLQVLKVLVVIYLFLN